LKTQTNPSLDSLKPLIESDSLIKSTEYISKKVQQFITKIQKNPEQIKFPQLEINSLVLNKIFDYLPKLLDFSFESPKEKVDRLKSFRFKFGEKSKNNQV